jgi:hypothetical protein
MSSGHGVSEYQLGTSGLQLMFETWSFHHFVMENPSFVITVVTDSTHKQ